MPSNSYLGAERRVIAQNSGDFRDMERSLRLFRHAIGGIFYVRSVSRGFQIRLARVGDDHHAEGERGSMIGIPDWKRDEETRG